MAAASWGPVAPRVADFADIEALTLEFVIIHLSYSALHVIPVAKLHDGTAAIVLIIVGITEGNIHTNLRAEGVLQILP